MVRLPRDTVPWRARNPTCKGHTNMSISLLVVIVLILLLIGALPTWGYSRSWGYGPTGGIGVILLIILVLWLLGVFH
jgi:hypothetical protein